MGYCMFLEEESFHIDAADKKFALAAIKRIDLRSFSWVNSSDVQRATSLEEACEAWRWPVETHDGGNVIAIGFHGEKSGDEDQLFAALAPYVKAGSFIHMSGEDGSHWKWEFDGVTVRENTARLVWD